MTDGRLSNEELVDVLSDVEDCWLGVSGDDCAALADKLRAHLATLQREADEMREALEPFVSEVSSWAPDFPPDGCLLGDNHPPLSLTWADLRRLYYAAAALKALPKQEDRN
jgi:hypothetical protein